MLSTTGVAATGWGLVCSTAGGRAAEGEAGSSSCSGCVPERWSSIGARRGDRGAGRLCHHSIVLGESRNGRHSTEPKDFNRHRGGDQGTYSHHRRRFGVEAPAARVPPLWPPNIAKATPAKQWPPRRAWQAPCRKVDRQQPPSAWRRGGAGAIEGGGSDVRWNDASTSLHRGHPGCLMQDKRTRKLLRKYRQHDAKNWQKA